MDLNFSGRYWTRDGIVVQVHKGVIGPTLSLDSMFWGHEVRLEPPYEDNRTFFWNGWGDCVCMKEPSLGVTNDSLSGFDLSRAVNAEEGEGSI